jgi:protein-tyrosine-phosphatase/predicted ATP-grasp superfamily ATP-dependent carboligase
VLVLDADAPAGLACVQSLGRAGATVDAAMRSPGSPTEYSRWTSRRYAQPPFEPIDAALIWLRELDAAHSYDLVIPSTEGSLRWLHALAESDPLRRRAQLPGNAALDIALDKVRTTEAAGRLGIPVPPSQRIPAGASVPAPLGFPAVLKPARSKVVVGQRLQSMSVELVHNSNERDAILTAWLAFTDVQEQQWVPGHGFGVEMLFDQGRMVWSFVHERLHELPLTGGASTLRRAAAPDDRLITWSRRLLEHLQWHGVAMIEWRMVHGQDPWLMEINPRFWGSLPLTIAAGRDAPCDLLRMALGETLEDPGPYRVGVVARNPEADLRWFVDNLRAARNDPMLLTEPIARAAVGWMRGLLGREAWDGWAWDDRRLLAHKAWRLLAVLPSGVLRIAGRPVARWRRLHHHRAVMRRIESAPRGPQNILILCYGNICRSPFAELALRRRAPKLEISSAGFHPVPGRTSPAHVTHAARDFGVALDGWSSCTLENRQIDAADLVLVMDGSHMERLAREFPGALRKSTQLGFFDPDGGDIEDPYEMDPTATHRVLQRLDRAIEALAQRLEQLSERSKPAVAG